MYSKVGLEAFSGVSVGFGRFTFLERDAVLIVYSCDSGLAAAAPGTDF